MLTFLLLQIVSSMPIYGNFSQYYYYVELQDKKWILDQNFDAAIEFASDSKLKEIYQESQIDRGICNPIKLDNYTVQAQRFIFIQTLFLDKNIKNQTKDDKQQINEDQQTQNNENQQTQDDKQQQINENQQTQDNENQQINENQQTQDDKQQINENQLQIGNFTIKKTWARNYSQLQEINNYLGLSKIVKNSSSDLKLKLCLAQNGGYMKIGNFPKGDEYIQIKQNCIQNLQCLINLQWIEIKYSTMMGLNLIKAEIDLSSSYVYFPPNIYSEVMQKLYCQGYFCPKRNDKNGLVCYDNNDDNLETFYDRFEKIKFKFEGENSFIWFPQDYLVTNDDKTFCFPIKRETSQIILGQPFMRNKEFIFGNKSLIINYQNCSLETSLDETTKNLFQIEQNKLERLPLGIAILISTLIITYILFKKNSQLIFDLKRDLHQTEYLITLEIDTQSKKNDFVVDTGAPYTSFICDQSSNQEKFKSLGCENVFSTYDGQWSCVINESHQIKIGNNSIDFNFGCVSNDATQILGMGNNNSFIKGLYDNSLVTSKNQIFSILLKQDKGILTIGQDYPNYEEVSIPINIYSQYYQVDLASIKDDKDSLNFQFNEINNYEIIIDSGSTLIVMDSELLQLFNKSFLKCETDPRGCPQQFQLLGKQCFLYDRTHYGDISNFFDTFPEFSFNFRNGYIFKLNAKDYLLKLNFYNYENFYCLPFIDFSRNYQTKYKKILLLGQPFMNNKEFYFDLTNQAIYVKNAEIQIEFTSKIFEHTTLYIQIGFLIGIYLFYRLYSTQIRGMLRGGLGNQGINAYG